MSASEKRNRVNGSSNGVNGTESRMQVVSDGAPNDLNSTRYEHGWRAGKPEEDPEKMKKWGLITARPSEFLIHMRRGSVREISGQGASCFKFPGDAVAIVPTSVQRLQFTADQVTSEKVGVQVTGLAVYRIVDPLVAFRMLNFSFPERASEKLAGAAARDVRRRGAAPRGQPLRGGVPHQAQGGHRHRADARDRPRRLRPRPAG